MGQATEEKAAEVVDATQGVGPLLERDYSGVITGSECTPEQIGAMLCEHFEAFAPAETAVFERGSGGDGKLQIGDELDIRIALQGGCRVRVVHQDERSLTLRTLEGHPEAGRITFGADCDDAGRLTFRIRSRTRASGYLSYLGYLVLGKQMQSRCWIRFIDRMAARCGGEIEGSIRVRTRKVEEEESDRKGHDEPTFRCGVGDG